MYSKVEDAIFCLPCVLFATKELGQFVCTGFNAWSRKTKRFACHNSTQYHQLALSHADALKFSFIRPESSITNCLLLINGSNIVTNRAIIKCMAEVILPCGKQCIALHGHKDDNTAEPSTNKGIFLAFLEYSMKSGNTIFANQFKTAAKNATYTSKTTQNELIKCISDHIRDSIIHEIKQAKYYSIFCDEVVDISSKEQVSIVLRFVDNNCGKLYHFSIMIIPLKDDAS